MTEYCLVKDDGTKWYPIAIDRLVGLLTKVIYQGTGFTHVYALRKNIAYNLQYLEYLHKCMENIRMSSVITTQTYKIFIIVGCGIVESLLAYLLIKSGNYNKTDWKLEYKIKGAPKKIQGDFMRIDSYVYKKQPSAKNYPMDFFSMIRKAENKNLLGSDHRIYPKLHHLRKLRNRIHLGLVDEPTDTDWNAFHYSDISDMAWVIYLIFTGSIFRPSEIQREYFSYLKKYIENSEDPEEDEIPF